MWGRGLFLVIPLGVMTVVTQAIADADGERDALARLAHEIETLVPLIAKAEAQADPDARIRFQCEWLRQDLDRARAGIQAHIDVPRAEPRKVEPLRGDYNLSLRLHDLESGRSHGDQRRTDDPTTDDELPAPLGTL